MDHSSYPTEAKEIAFDRKQAVLLLVIPAMRVIVLNTLILGESPNVFAILISGCMLMINISVFYLYNILIEKYAYQNQLEVIMESQNRVRALRHDMKNLILALQVLVQRAEREETNKYLESMKNFMTNPEEDVKTGNDSIDSLLNYKM